MTSDNSNQIPLQRHFSQKFSSKKILFEKKSQFQHIVIFENTYFGRILLLDGIVQTTEADEFIYHEMFAHTPLFAHDNPKSVLIIGGGDGGLLREVLRHQAVEKVDMVEIDGDVVTACQKYMPRISRNSYDDPRVNLVIADAVKYIQKTPNTYDVILADTTDPGGPSMVLFSQNFFNTCYQHLNKNGIFVNQCGIPFLCRTHHIDIQDTLDTVFKQTSCYQVGVPTYIGGPMVFVIASDNPESITPNLSTLKARYAALDQEMLCYNPQLHLSSFVLPNYMNNVLWLKL